MKKRGNRNYNLDGARAKQPHLAVDMEDHQATYCPGRVRPACSSGGSEVEEDGRASAAAAPCHPRCGEDGRRTGLRRCFPCWGRRLGRRRTHPHHGRTWPEARRRPPRASSIRPDASCCCSAAGAPPPPRPPRHAAGGGGEAAPEAEEVVERGAVGWI